MALPISDAPQLSLEWLGARPTKWGPLSPDRWVLGVTYMLALSGLVMIFSASGVMAENRYGDSMFFFKRQAIWLILGIMVMHGVANVDYRRWKPFIPALYGIIMILLILVLVPFIGVEVNGARRWFRVGDISLQPAEMAKVSVLLYLAAFLSNKEDQVCDFFSGFLPPVVLVGCMAGLVLLEPDFGTTVILGLLLVELLFLGGARLMHLCGLFLIIILSTVALIWGSEYRLRRFLNFLDPWQDSMGAGFQLTQSFVALGSGGFWGVGLGESKQKLFFLPEGHSDFVLALIGEELGFVGTGALILLLGIFIFKGCQIAHYSQDPFGRFLGFGVVLLLGGQALMNMGVVTGLLPTKGLTLPLVSYGGSSLVTTMFAIGLLLSISRGESLSGTPRSRLSR